MLVVAGMAVAAPAADATLVTSLTPAGHDFGGQAVGTTSAPQPFTLRVMCSDVPLGFVCGKSDSVVPAVDLVGGDFAQTNNCPGILQASIPLVPVTCTINVTFTPTFPGTRLGTLTAGGFSRPLYGTGVAPALAPTFDLQAAIKWCKKKFPKGPKRKRCIKKANARARG
jgi:hypothetical protein